METRLFVAGLIFLVTALDMKFGSGEGALDIAALVAGGILTITVVLDYIWLDRPGRRRPSTVDRDPR